MKFDKNEDVNSENISPSCVVIIELHDRPVHTLLNDLDVDSFTYFICNMYVGMNKW